MELDGGDSYTLRGDETLQSRDLLAKDLCALQKLTVPVPKQEVTRLKLLRETNLLDSAVNEGDYQRFTSLASRVFKVSS